MHNKLSGLCSGRFNKRELEKKQRLWKILCDDFFQKFISPDSALLDIGAGYCEFINNIKAKEKYAVDLNPDTARFAAADIKVITCQATNINIPDNSIDVIFISNFLEHMETKDEVLSVLNEAYRVCRPGGTILVLQPNIRYIYKNYWDFFDHKVPLSDKSLVEGLELVGFKITKVYPKFLPYTTKSKFPWNDFIIKMYLQMPFAWNLFGAQAFVSGQK